MHRIYTACTNSNLKLGDMDVIVRNGYFDADDDDLDHVLGLFKEYNIDVTSVEDLNVVKPKKTKKVDIGTGE
jgi:hypothetical protein